MKAKGVVRIILRTEDNKKFFGKGPYMLLLKVKELGSLNKAAKEMGMSYSKAFNVIKSCEKALNKKFLYREIGGIKGGGSKLTEDGEKIIEQYEHIVSEMNEKMNSLLDELNF
ncbi:winged helix-turn-helix domain-containing protein [Miniphocaeibacter halophilus]|uniref:LysR family transcriptional regulator n=1 Tax=Miniphocaeibacter halophilus TaxID=2931922 RepID=A0AC61MPN2_9FIRM|nr:LysR family transcriptional regulator [Miniphocaeibacter halophilus]QQK07123.1 LysR family transcriptional regulator [Miniphocaeibacter halophilus]